jgi:hypothetical protein
MGMSATSRSLYSARVIVLGAVIAVSLSAIEVTGEQEFYVEKFLRERDEWLKQTFPVSSV